MTTNSTRQLRVATVDASQSLEWFLAETLLGTGRTGLLTGYAGTGKTYAAATHQPVDAPPPVIITITDETSAADLLGYYINGPHGFVWQDGPATTAMRTGARLVINEIDHANNDARAVLYAIADEAMTASVSGLRLHANETVRPAAGFHVIATTNACKEEALTGAGILSRFSNVVEVNEPHPAALAALPEDLRTAAKASCTNSDESQRLTMRTWRSFAALREQLGDTLTAARIAFGIDRGPAIVDSLAVARA